MATGFISSSNNIEDLLDQLPKQFFWETVELYQWEEFWYPPHLLQGTTWLKALCASIIRGNIAEEEDDEIAVKNPHDVVKNLEYSFGVDKLRPDELFAIDLQSPRLFQTHLPYSSLPDSMKNNTECKIVYIARNPKDTLVSMWYFLNKLYRANQAPYPFEKAFDSFYKGVQHHGPYLDHVLQYWMESLKNPKKILFLKYEDLKGDPKGEVKRLASFLGRPFAEEDEVDKVLWRSSIERLKSLEVNKKGAVHKIPNNIFFRLGGVGDWKNYFTDEMKQALDEITRRKLEGSGLHFED